MFYPIIQVPPVAKNDVVQVIVDKGAFEIAGRVIGADALVPFANGLLKAKPLGIVILYPREGIAYGELVHGVDCLRKTDAKIIAVAPTSLAYGRET